MQKQSMIRMGIFVFLAVLAFVVGILSLGDRKGWFEEYVIISAQFKDIDGLENGAPVRISGINAGKVKAVIPPKKVGDMVILQMEVNLKFKDLLTDDAVAHIETEGLVGYKLVIIDPGSESSKAVEQGGFVSSREPVKLSDITAKFYQASANVEDLVAGLAGVTDSIRRGKGSIGRLISDPTLYQNITSASVSVDSAFSAFARESREITDILNNISVSSNEIIQKINRGEGTIGKLIGSDSLYRDIRSSSEQFIKVVTQLENGVYAFSENMEALKHNWFFKGYFEDRGYWDRKSYEEADQLMKQRKAELEQLKKDLNDRYQQIIEREAKLKELEEGTKKNPQN